MACNLSIKLEKFLAPPFGFEETGDRRQKKSTAKIDFPERDMKNTDNGAFDLSKGFQQDAKDVAAFLFVKYRHHVKSIALQYAPIASVADEIVQQVFLKFIDEVEQWDFSGNLKNLLSVLTRNIAKDRWRAEAKHFPKNLFRVAEHIRRLAGENDNDSYAHELDALQDCLEKAPEKSRELVRLHYFGEMSMKQIAEKMNLHPDTLYQAFFRLRQKLRKCIDQSLRGDETHV